MAGSIGEQIEAIATNIKNIFGQEVASCTISGDWTKPCGEAKEEKVKVSWELHNQERMDTGHFICTIAPYITIGIIAAMAMVIFICKGSPKSSSTGEQPCSPTASAQVSVFMPNTTGQTK